MLQSVPAERRRFSSCPGSSPGSPSSGMCPERLTRRSRRLPKHMANTSCDSSQRGGAAALLRASPVVAEENQELEQRHQNTHMTFVLVIFS